MNTTLRGCVPDDMDSLEHAVHAIRVIGRPMERSGTVNGGAAFQRWPYLGAESDHRPKAYMVARDSGGDSTW
jgi:hypothetical protein